ncbi:MAG: hypothetical protein WC661_20105 [Opitutaceae bacterium]|jgi:hypothetical protein
MAGNFQDEFGRSVAAVVTRFLKQNGLVPAGAEELRALAAALMTPIAGRVEEGELPEAFVKAGVARVLAVFSPPRPELANLAKQLIKGCHQPDKSPCCESYRETDEAGRCRRQEPAYDLARVSGAHCVDCPHWRGWSPEEHAARLAAEWRDGAEAFAANRAVFLPEDFRMLRRCAQERG